MPRAQNPLATHRTLKAKAEQTAKQADASARDAHAFVGKLVFDAGLSDWELKDLKAGMKHLKELGPEALRKPGKPKTASPATDASTATIAAE